MDKHVVDVVVVALEKASRSKIYSREQVAAAVVAELLRRGLLAVPERRAQSDGLFLEPRY